MLVLALAGCSSPDRQAVVADRGSKLMPFDLDRTTHRFSPVGNGLVQEVVADDPTDTGQVELIRGHLVKEVSRFTSGDYGDPAQIHGRDMPGLVQLEAGAADIVIRYEDLPPGGRITFFTTRADVVTALARWAAAQAQDHGKHAK